MGGMINPSPARREKCWCSDVQYAMDETELLLLVITIRKLVSLNKKLVPLFSTKLSLVMRALGVFRIRTYVMTSYIGNAALVCMIRSGLLLLDCLPMTSLQLLKESQNEDKKYDS